MILSYKKLIIALIAGFILLYPPITKSQIIFDIESGVIFTGYNDVRIPGSTGTFISLPDDLGSKPGLFARLSLRYKIGESSEIFVLYAPLKVKYEGEVENEILFYGKTFSPVSSMLATYKFNSYRITYRYNILQRSNLYFGLGLTIKVRDAYIGIEQGSLGARKTDLGFVPLVNFAVNWNPYQNIGFILKGDALGVRSGRAEDVLLAITHKASENITLKAGYRILEGGADNAKLYTFSLFHYGVIGAAFTIP